MKFNKLLIFILIVFLKTGNVLSNNAIFDVNNIEIEKKPKTSNIVLANQAIKKGFIELTNKILIEKDIKKLQSLKFSEIKELVKYYQISNKINNSNSFEVINFNISFDKDKIHNLFYTKNISYSDITNKELFIIPILKKKDQIFIYNKNFFYDNWNEFSDTELIEFILPLENIEIIQNANLNKDNLLNLQLNNLFKEYLEKNIALVLIEQENSNDEKIYLKTKILGKEIVKNIIIKRQELTEEEFYKKTIALVKQEIINLIKLQSLIDVRAPSFLNAELIMNQKKNNLVEFRSRIKKIDSIENIYIQKLNNKSVFLKIKFLGNIEKVIRQLEIQKIFLEFENDQWSIKIT
jgi:hypothetical protein